jgi:hypothetical protein
MLTSMQLDGVRNGSGDRFELSSIPSYKMILSQDNLSLSNNLLRSALLMEGIVFELMVPDRGGRCGQGGGFLSSADTIFPRAKVTGHPGLVYAVLRAETVDS